LQNIGEITTVDAYPVKSLGGTVTISSHSPLTIGKGGIFANSDVSLLAGASGGADNLKIGGPVSSTMGSIALEAGDNLTILSGVHVSAASGISLTAGANIDVGGIVSATNGAIAFAAGQNVNIGSDGQLTATGVGGVVAVTAGGIFAAPPGSINSPSIAVNDQVSRQSADEASTGSSVVANTSVT
jgi:uncharacterized protein (DUF2345 family)